MLKGKAAVITGSTSGIGLAYAKRFAAEGADVMINGFGDPGEIEDIRAGLERDHGVAAAYSGADLTDPAAIEAMVEAARAKLGRIDVMVHNAGIQHTDPVEKFPPEKWDAIIALHLSAAFHLVRLTLPEMKARGWGRLIFTASAHGLVASVNKAGYVSAKHGMIGLTKVVGLEAAGTGVTCNAICPGWVRTPLVERQIEALAAENGTSVEEAAKQLLGAKQPSQQFVQPEDLAGLAVFLCSDAAAQMTGTSVSMDGGWCAQ
jgi:3-hydroxybutyrate dehydrogenase